MHMQKENMTTRLAGPDPLSFLPERQMHTVICEGGKYYSLCTEYTVYWIL
jgi:hypothetical protein